MKGANALRVEERIARVPLDLVRPAGGEIGIFEAIKALGRDDEESREAPRQRPRPQPASGRPKAAQEAVPKAASAARGRAAAREAAARLGPESFSKAERRAIVLSCTEYRNRLPTYLLSAKREVEIIDSILRKCERAEREAKGEAERGPGGASGHGSGDGA
jgi:hypothetical protein